MRNPIKRYLENIAVKALKNSDNQLFRQMFQFLNEDNPVWISDNMEDYIKKAYMLNDFVYSVISTKAEAAKSINWLAYEVKDEKAFKEYKALTDPSLNLKESLNLRKKALVEIENKTPNKLLQRPNAYQSIGEVVEEYFSWIDICGNFYLYGLDNALSDGRFDSIHVAPAHYVEIMAGNFINPIKGYRIKNWMNEIIPAEKILHMKLFNPDFDTDGRQLYGMSPLKAASRIISVDNMGVDSTGKAFENSGVRGIISRELRGNGSDGVEFTTEQAKQIQEKIESWKGTKRAKDIVATNAPVRYTKIGESPVDLGILESMGMNLKRICNALKVPVEIFTDGTTFSNKAEARKHMITTGVLPRMNILRDKLNSFWIDPFNKFEGKRYYIDYDIMSISELQDDLNNLANMAKTMDWITINEKRAITKYGENDNPLADEILVNPSLTPLSMLGDIDMTPTNI
jgi:HK97 family phage portal protein